MPTQASSLSSSVGFSVYAGARTRRRGSEVRSVRRPAEVEQERRAGGRPRLGAQEPRGRRPDLGRLEEPFHGLGPEQVLLRALLELRLDEGGADVRRAERRGGDAQVGALEGEYLHEADHAVLRRDVAGLERRGNEAVHRGDGQEAAVPGGGERVPRVLREQERARDEQRQQPLPLFLRELAQRR